jgi:uncharacterized protein YprB with RNaseH-like and TPR domain
MVNYFILDIETCPLNAKDQEPKTEEEKLKLINPIDSEVVAIGVRKNEVNHLFMAKTEKEILEEFWSLWREIVSDSPSTFIVGYNILNFDIPFLVTRSLINNVKIKAFTLKSILDLRQKVTAYRYGYSRGKLKDFARTLGVQLEPVDGSDIERLYIQNDWESIKRYLEKDLLLTDKLYQRCLDTNIIGIYRY